MAPSAKLPSTVLSVTRVPLTTGSPPTIANNPFAIIHGVHIVALQCDLAADDANARGLTGPFLLLAGQRATKGDRIVERVSADIVVVVNVNVPALAGPAADAGGVLCDLFA